MRCQSITAFVVISPATITMPVCRSSRTRRGAAAPARASRRAPRPRSGRQPCPDGLPTGLRREEIASLMVRVTPSMISVASQRASQSPLFKRPARAQHPAHRTVFTTPPKAKKCGLLEARLGRTALQAHERREHLVDGPHECSEARRSRRAGSRAYASDAPTPQMHRELRERLERGRARDADVHRQRDALAP